MQRDIKMYFYPLLHLYKSICLVAGDVDLDVEAGDLGSVGLHGVRLHIVGSRREQVN